VTMTCAVRTAAGVGGSQNVEHRRRRGDLTARADHRADAVVDAQRRRAAYVPFQFGGLACRNCLGVRHERFYRRRRRQHGHRHVGGARAGALVAVNV